MNAKANYKAYFELIYNTIGTFTPLEYDCGTLCGGRCCKGDDNTGMVLFPHEEEALDLSHFKVIEKDSSKLVVCNGKCDRENRPLACRIFPFFPTINADGRIEVLPDPGANAICPMLHNIDVIRFDKYFLRSVRRAGRLLSVDDDCREYIKSRSKEIGELLPLIFESKPKSLIRK